jgi:hypothetical protein
MSFLLQRIYFLIRRSADEWPTSDPAPSFPNRPLDLCTGNLLLSFQYQRHASQRHHNHPSRHHSHLTEPGAHRMAACQHR